MKKIVYSFVNKKVIRIGDKNYSSIEKIPSVEDNSIIIVIREMELKERTHKHFAGDLKSFTYEKVKHGLKGYISLEKWNSLEDINTLSYKVYAAYNF